MTLHALCAYTTVTHFTYLLGFRVFQKVSNVAIAPMYFGSYHSSLFLVGFPGYSSSASETDSTSLADLPVSSTSFDRDRRPRHLRTRTGGSLYSQMRLSLMLAVKSKRSSWSWNSTLFCCVLRQCNSYPLTTATLSTQKKIQQCHPRLVERH